MYLAIYDWPQTGKLYLPGLESKLDNAYLLSKDGKKKLKHYKENNWTIFNVPYEKPDSKISVIELKFKDNNIIIDNTQAVDPDMGISNLSVKFSKAENCQIRKSSWMEKFGEWKHKYCVSNLNKGGNVKWDVLIKEPGIYQVSLSVRGNGRYVWKVESDEGKFVQNQQGASSIFTQSSIGWINFEKSGKHTLTARLLGGGIADLSSISLVPVVF